MSTPLFQPRNRAPRLAEAAVERARLTVVPRRTTVAPRVPFVSLVSVLLIGGIVGLLLFNTNMQQASFVASSMEEQAAVLAGKEESLRMQLHRLRDPQNVAAQAKKLGMVPSSSPAFIRLTDGKVLGRPAVAEPGSGIRIAPLPPAKPRPELVIAEIPKSVLAAAARDARAQDRAARAQDRARDLAADRRDTTGPSAGTSPDQRATQRTKNKEKHRPESRERTP